MLQEVNFLANSGDYFYSFDSHSAYQLDADITLPSIHPRNMQQSSSKIIIDFQRLFNDSRLRQLYFRSDLKSLVQNVTGINKLYLSECPYNAAYYNIYKSGDKLGWHFDKSSFGVNVVLQPPSAGGGLFQFHHKTRSNEDMFSYGNVSKILSGDFSNVVTLEDVKAGSLIIFSGKYSLHRVSHVNEGGTPRINAILTYETIPGKKLDNFSLKKFFGRDDQEKI